jgi:hypothetical protein
MNKKIGNGLKKRLSFDKKEKWWFLTLLNHYKLSPSKLDILSLAQIIYYIEKNSFK